MEAPTTAALLNDPGIQQALELAWTDSLPSDPARRHEEGGWIYMDTTTGMISVQRASAGTQAALDLTAPPIINGSVVVATFHTHPNPSADGWHSGPSVEDTQSAWLFGVPCLIRADDGSIPLGQMHGAAACREDQAILFDGREACPFNGV